MTPNSTINIVLPNGDRLYLINSSGKANPNYISVDTHSGVTLKPVESVKRETTITKAESVGVDSLKDGRLKTYFNITSYIEKGGE